MAFIPMEMAENTETITRKAYPVTGGGTSDYCRIYRFGNIRIISGRFPQAGSGTVFATLDAIDRPKDETFFASTEWTNKKSYAIKIGTDGNVTQGGTVDASQSTFVNGVYVTNYS